MLPKVLSRGMAARTAVAAAVRQQHHPARAQLPAVQSLCTGPCSSQQQATRTFGSSASAESLKASVAADADKASCSQLHQHLCSRPLVYLSSNNLWQKYTQQAGTLLLACNAIACCAWPSPPCMLIRKVIQRHYCAEMHRSTSGSWACRRRWQSCWRARAPTTTSRWTLRP